VGRLYRYVFPRFQPRDDLRPFGMSAPPPEAARVRWLGTAGYVIETATTTLLIDPYLTRAPLATLATAKLEPDERAIRARIPRRVDAVLCGHSHFDHLLDAPFIAAITGAKLVGSPTTLAFGRAHGLAPDQLVEVGEHGRELSVGDVGIRFVPSLHAKILLGRVPFPGTVTSAPRPAHAWQYRMGGAFGIYLRTGSVTIYHNGSADLVDAELYGEADLLLVGIAGWRVTPSYVERLTGLLRPSVVVPAHHDAFFAPLDAGFHLLPKVDLDGFVDEVGRVAPKAQIVTPGYDETLWFDRTAGRAVLSA
jgi:L-ascorbate metabolism protein UlaG (beta-lactamase superfamily)